MSIAPNFLKENSSIRSIKAMKKDSTNKKAELTAKQKKLPPALQKAMLKKQAKAK